MHPIPGPAGIFCLLVCQVSEANSHCSSRPRSHSAVYADKEARRCFLDHLHNPNISSDPSNHKKLKTTYLGQHRSNRCQEGRVVVCKVAHLACSCRVLTFRRRSRSPRRRRRSLSRSCAGCESRSVDGEVFQQGDVGVEEARGRLRGPLIPPNRAGRGCVGLAPGRDHVLIIAADKHGRRIGYHRRSKGLIWSRTCSS
jgi:hypothetical protein